MKLKSVFLFFFILVYIEYNHAQNTDIDKYSDLSLDFETRAFDLVSKMTLDEKISQLGADAPAIPRLKIQKYHWWNECLHGVARAVPFDAVEI